VYFCCELNFPEKEIYSVFAEKQVSVEAFIQELCKETGMIFLKNSCYFKLLFGVMELLLQVALLAT
jgi:hypothetical protein